MNLYTKNGKPLQVYNNIVYSKSGIVIGKIRSNKVYGTNGNYVGTIIGDRLVYRSTDSIGKSSVFTAANICGTAKCNQTGLAVLGDEPNIPD